MTTGTDTFVGTAGNDTIIATSSTLSAEDRIIDTSSTDSDVMNITATAALPQLDVTGIESINVDWASLLTPTLDLDNVSGATVTISSTKAGYGGNANLDKVASNDVVFGAGLTGTVTVDGIEDASVTASVAKTVDVGTGTAANGTITVDAGAATTVNVTGGDDVTVTALSATDVTVDGADAETATINLGVDADLTVTAVATGEVALNSDADITVTVEAASVYDSLTVGGEGSVTLSLENIADLDDKDVTGAAVVAIEDAIATADLSGVSTGEFRLETEAGGNATLTVATGSTFVFEAEETGAHSTTFQTTADDDSTADALNITLEDEQGGALIFDTADQEIETVNLAITPNSDFDNTTVFDVADLQGNSAANTAFVVTSEDSDVEVKIAAVDAASVDASAVAGEFEMAQTSAESMAVIGAAGANTITFAATSQESTFVSTNTEDDEVNFVNTDGAAAATFAGGDNTVKANALTSGSIYVLGNSGDETVELDGLTTGTATLELGDGDNSVLLGDTGNLAGATVAITAGSGDDTLTFEDDTVAATSVTFDMGTGTNTLDLTQGVDLTDGTISLTGLTTIAYGSAFTTNVSDSKVDAALLTGQDYKLTGDGDIADLVAVDIDEAGSYDFSSLDIDNTISKAVGGLSVTGSTGADTIVGSTGNDTIDGNGGVDIITGGLGMDTITADTSGSTVVYTGATGEVYTGAYVSGTTDFDDASSAATDWVTAGSTTGDKLYVDLSATNVDYTDGALSIATSGNGLSGTSGNIALTAATDASGVLTSSGSGTHTLIQYDTNGTTAGGIQNIVVVGLVASATMTDGVLELTMA